MDKSGRGRRELERCWERSGERRLGEEIEGGRVEEGGEREEERG